MLENRGKGEGEVFRMWGSGNGWWGKRGKKNGKKIEKNENIKCFGELIIGKKIL